LSFSPLFALLPLQRFRRALRPQCRTCAAAKIFSLRYAFAIEVLRHYELSFITSVFDIFRPLATTEIYFSLSFSYWLITGDIIHCIFSAGIARPNTPIIWLQPLH